MKEFISIRIKLDSIADVNEFVKLAEKNIGDVDVRSDRYIVDGKSILGILSLDLKNPLIIDIYGGNLADKINNLYTVVKRYKNAFT